MSYVESHSKMLQFMAECFIIATIYHGMVLLKPFALRCRQNKAVLSKFSNNFKPIRYSTFLDVMEARGLLVWPKGGC